jgi:hypothetical protein
MEMKFNNPHTILPSILENMANITKNLEENLDEFFTKPFRIVDCENKIEFGNLIRRKLDVDLLTSKFNKDINNGSMDVLTKSFKIKCRVLHEFTNELLTYQQIELMSIRKEFFAECVGFILGEYENHPYYGTIIIKWYRMGDLSKFSKTIRNTGNAYRRNTGIAELRLLTDLAHQVAQGLTFK